MEGFVFAESLIYTSFAVVFIVGVILGFFVISLIGSREELHLRVMRRCSLPQDL